MRKILMAMGVFVVACSLSVAGEIGPPEPVGVDAMTPVSIGIGYSRTAAQFKPSSSSILDLEDLDLGLPDVSLQLLGHGETTVRQQLVYLQVAFRFLDDFEVYGRIGGADLVLDDMVRILEGQLKAGNFKDSTMRPYMSLGGRGMLYKGENVGVGPFFQASFYSNYRDRWAAPMDDVYMTARWRGMWDLSTGLSAQASIGDAIIYGGPVIYASGARVRHTISFFGEELTERVKYKERGNLGSFIGARIPLPAGIEVGVEGRYRSAFSMGFSVARAF